MKRKLIQALGIGTGAAAIIAPRQIVYVRDRFTDTNGTQLTAHTPNIDLGGGGWVNAAIGGTATGASASISSNQATIAQNNRGAVIDAGIVDVLIEVQWITQASQTNNGAVVARYVDNSNHGVRFRCREDTGDITLFRQSAGADTTIDSDSYAFSEGVTYTLKVKIFGTSVTCYINGVEVLSGTSAVHTTATKHGIIYNGGVAPLYDNFTVKGAT